MHVIQSIDIGNAALKSFRGVGQPALLESLVAEIPSGARTSAATRGTKSRLISYLEGSRSDLVGQSWMMGSAAREYSQHKILARENDKIKYALQAVMAAVQFPEGSHELSLEQLVTFLPEIRAYEEPLMEALVGTHLFSRNGVTFRLIIADRSKVLLLQEGQGAANFCYAMDLVNAAEHSYLGLIDIGGGTMIGTLFTSEGGWIEESRFNVGRGKAGVYSGLAVSLCQHPDFVRRLREAPSSQIVLEGITTAKYDTVFNEARNRYGLVSRSPIYYGNTRVRYDDLLSEVHSTWLRESVQQILGAWSQWSQRIGSIAIVGGGAVFAASLVDNPNNSPENGLHFFVPQVPQYPNTPQMCNVIGGYPGISNAGDLATQNGSTHSIAVIA